MADREKVIKCLEACTGETDDCAGHTCPYWDFDDSVNDHGCRIQMELDALELLKEQVAVEPKVIRMNSFGHPVHTCGKCRCLVTESMNYCSQCGQAVKWE